MALATLAAPPPADQLATPLDYLFADHFRLRTLCRMIDLIADDESCDDECIESVLRFLREDFVPHIHDEEEDLFPMLRVRTEPEDRIDDILDTLIQEHAADRLDAEAIVAGLSRMETGNALSRSFRKQLRRFAANERRHLTLENAIVLPLARARLKIDDLRNLGRNMAARRGIGGPEASDAV